MNRLREAGMNKTNWLIFGFFMILIVTGWYLYQKYTDDTYEGMSIIPEEHKDIPFFKGLEPTEVVYVIDGNQWGDIHDFYLEELPRHGWILEYNGSALHDKDPENDWGGFHTRWRKKGFEGELIISAHYNQFDERTEVIFDKTPIYNATIWIKNVPTRICIYQSVDDEKCSVVKDTDKIKKVVGYINKAMDWQGEVLPRDKPSLIEFEELSIEVHYENEKEIYFISEKGTKIMKPEPDFFTLTNLLR